MLEIIFVRHGESIMNRNQVFCGWTDSKLTDKGILQAEIVCEKLKKEDLNLIISSDLDRCYKTAQIINKKHGIEIIQEFRLRELNFGKWEGLSYNEICKKYSEESKCWERDYINYKLSEGESLVEMYDRVNRAYKDILKRYEKGKILIVSHSGVIRAILSHEICQSIEGYWKFKVDNCGITRLQYVEGFPILTAINM